METYEVGPSNLPQYELDHLPIDYPWVAYWYEDNGYDGDGFLAAMNPDGRIETKSLCHCSCYGPIDGPWPRGNGATVEDFLAAHVKSSNALDDDDAEQAVVKKVKELLGLS